MKEQMKRKKSLYSNIRLSSGDKRYLVLLYQIMKGGPSQTMILYQARQEYPTSAFHWFSPTSSFDHSKAFTLPYVID